MTHSLVRLLVVDHASDGANGLGPDPAERSLGIPVDDLGEALLLEVRIEGGVVAVLQGEHGEDVTQA